MKFDSIRNLHNFWLGILLGALILSGWYFIFRHSTNGGASSPEELVQLYLSGLSQKDFSAIKRLVPEDHNAEAEIHEKINKLGTKDLTKMKFKIQDNAVNPAEHKTALMLDGPSTIQIDEIYLQKYDGKRWYLILGTWQGLKSLP